MSIKDIHAPDKPRFSIYTIDGFEGDGFVWDEGKKLFESDWVVIDGRTGRLQGRKRIPLKEVVSYTTDKEEKDAAETL